MLKIINPINGAELQVAALDFSQKMTWDEAKRACVELGSGWRLPTIEEIKEMYNQLHKKEQGNFQETFYWSGSVDYSGKAWNFCMIDGTAYSGILSSNEDTNSVRAVCDLAHQNLDEVKIGNQVWMKKNLDVDTFRNGDLIPHVTSDEEWEEFGNQGKPAWCYYNYDIINGEKYGKLYNWYAVNDPRGLAPEGWHVPSHKEWESLVDYLGGEKEAGAKMKSKNGWSEANFGNGTDEVGFSGLAGGLCFSGGGHMQFGSFGYWWSSTEKNKIDAWYCYLHYHNINASMDIEWGKTSGMSVRCIKG